MIYCSTKVLINPRRFRFIAFGEAACAAGKAKFIEELNCCFCRKACWGEKGL